MCRFTGYLLSNKSWKNSKETKQDLLNLSEGILHRGPDSGKVFLDEENKLGLAFQRLSILDLSEEAMQPMISDCRKWVVVFNGEIYNYKVLKENLLKRSLNYDTNSDTKVIVECISMYGFTKTISMLDGMFAVAAYSFSDKNLWLARDKFGEKPLYYSKDINNNFFFGSDIKSLGSSRYFEKRIDYNVSIDYIRYGYVPDPLCILQNTYKLSPGTILRFNHEKKIQIDEYWNSFLEFKKSREKPYKGTYEDALEEVKFKIKLSTNTRLVSDVPIGAFLSGGIDSSNLVYSLKKDNVNIETFSIGFQDEKKNEAHFAKEISSLLNISHNEKILNNSDCINVIPDIVKYYDEPFADPSQIPTFLLSKFAREKIKVAISGDGADELFGGYPRYQNISNFWEILHRFPEFFKNKMRDFSFFFSGINMKGARSLGKKLRKYSHANIESLYNDQLSRCRPDEGFYQSNYKSISNFNKNFSFNKKVISNYRYLMIRDFLTYLPSNLLVKIDRASMANSLEVRSPYLDPNLVKFVWSMPDDYIYRNKVDKAILRDILSERFSKKIYARNKQGFEPPLDLWLKGALKDWAYETISKNDDILNNEKLKSLFRAFLKGEKKLTYKLWSLIMFKAWRNHNGL